MRVQQASGLLSFEHFSEPILSRKKFNRRLITSVVVGLGILTFSLILGMIGYKYIVGVEGWDDAFYNASMILTGMGPVIDGSIKLTSAAKIFSGIYAIYSGVAFLSGITIVFSPLIHRFLHCFHVDSKN